MSSMQQPAEVVAEEKYYMEIKNAKIELELANLKWGNKSLARSMLRLAYAYQFTLAAKSHDHAANKTKSTDEAPSETKSTDEAPSETKKENNQPAANNDFQKAIALCGEIKKKYPTITYADIYQLAGVVAVKVLDGPEIEIKFVPGRKDTSITPDEGCLPDDQLGASDLRDFFYPMELGNKDIVALYGGLKLAHSKGSGVEGSLTKEPFKLDNRYFVELLRSSLKELPPTEKALFKDSTFRYFVELYAKDKQAFFNDYKEAHKTFSEYEPPSSSFTSALRKVQHATVTQKAVGVAIAAAAAILSFFYLIKRRRASEHSSQNFHEPSVPVTINELKKLETNLSNKKENEN